MKTFGTIRNLSRHAGHLMAVLFLASGMVGCSPGGLNLVVTDEDGVEHRGPLNAGLTDASGDFRAVLTLKYPDGSPAVGLPYVVKCPVASSNVVVGAGNVSTEGSVLIDGLAGGKPPVMYSVEIAGEFVGNFSVGTDPEVRGEFILRATPGMSAPSLTLKDLASGKRFDVLDFRGQLVFLEFYTTDCAPCQPMLQKLNEVLGRRTDEWEGKVNVFAVGLDAVQHPNVAADRIAAHLRRKGWKHLRPVVPDQDFSSEPSRRHPFGVHRTPYAFLIGRHGRIVWSGHPGSVDLENLIEGSLRSEPDGPSNGSQPIRSETNRTSSAAGSRR
jgi:thiol-disulfide isomerase/thioredoxin